jgi:hypothetical protein
VVPVTSRSLSEFVIEIPDRGAALCGLFLFRKSPVGGENCCFMSNDRFLAKVDRLYYKVDRFLAKVDRLYYKVDRFLLEVEKLSV